MLRGTLLLFFGLVFFVAALAQNKNNYYNVTPPTPEAAAIAKNVDIPMNYSSGVPQIGVNLSGIVNGSLSISVGLSYNASGIRVDEGATRVGLGWNMNIGPTLQRSVRGLPDESSTGYINSPNYFKVRYVDSMLNNCLLTSQDCGCPLTPSISICQLWDIYIPNNMIDLESDIFSFSAMGYSGKFYWNQDSSKFIFAPYQNIKIEYTLSSFGFNSFTLILPNGQKCYFGGSNNYIEKLENGNSISVVNGVTMAGVNDNNAPYATSWAINYIEDVAGKQIVYNYVQERSVEGGRGTEKFIPGSSSILGTPGKTESYYKNQFVKPIVSSISGENGTIIFKQGAVREDIRQASTDYCKVLDSVIVFDKFNNCIKKYALFYHYTTATDNPNLLYLLDIVNYTAKRLILDSLIEMSGDGLASIPAYKFVYNTQQQLPNRLSAAQDYWGYYNGKLSNNTLLPAYLSSTSTVADRRIDEQLMQTAILTKMFLPTGGVTEYNYEAHEVSMDYFDASTEMIIPDMLDKSKNILFVIPENPPYPNLYSDTFSIIRPATKVKIQPNMPLPCNMYNADAGCYYEIKIRRASDYTLLYSFNTTATNFMSLDEGNYIIEGSYTNPNPNEMPNWSIISLSWGEHPQLNNFKTGGLRVKKIVVKDNIGKTIARSFTYRHPINQEFSSGVLSGFPTHITYVRTPITNIPLSLSQRMLSSNSSVPLTSDGQTVVYKFVTEFLDSATSSIKTEYEFYTDLNFSKIGNPFGTPMITRPWQNGVVKGKKVFEKTSNNTYRVLHEEQSVYLPFNATEYMIGLSGSQLLSYNLASDWFLNTGAILKNYSYANNGTQQNISSHTNEYNSSNYLLSKTTSSSSKGNTLVTRSWYANDFNNVGNFNINTLKNKNIISLPIKQESSSNGKLVNGTITKYNTLGLPEEFYAYESNILIDTLAHNPNAIVTAGYNIKATLLYNGNKIVNAITNNTEQNSFIWQYNSTLGIERLAAKVENTDQYSIGFTSFENSFNHGNWYISGGIINNGGVVGNGYYNSGNFNIVSSADITSSKEYFVSYWSNQANAYTITGTSSGYPQKLYTVIKDGITWNFFRHKITGVASISISGSGFMDELRLHSSDAQMVTYSYNSSGQVTSLTDPNGRTTYYEYDSFNRLKLIKDQDGKILKVYQYQYQANTNQ